MLDLLSGSVSRTGVGHGVATVSVSDKLHEEGTLAGSNPILGPLGGLSDSEDVHTVNLVRFDISKFFPIYTSSSRGLEI